MSEERRRRAEAARVGAEAGRQSAEADREGAEREDADSRQRAEKDREEAEGHRNQAESRRRVADMLPLLPRSRWAVLLVFLCFVLAGAAPALVATFAVSRHEANRAQADTERVTQHVFTQVCLRNDLSKAGTILGEERRVMLVKKAGLGEGVLRAAQAGLRQVKGLNQILDCQRTFSGGGVGVPLPGRVVEQYLRIVRTGFIPELEGDRIVGKHRPETEGHADF